MGESKSKTTPAAVTNVNPTKLKDSNSANTDKVRSTVKPLAELTYGKTQFRYMWIGIGLIALGMILMSGGWMPSPEVWDDNIIYSARRTVLAPICILAGLAMQVLAIFK